MRECIPQRKKRRSRIRLMKCFDEATRFHRFVIGDECVFSMRSRLILVNRGWLIWVDLDVKHSAVIL